MCSHIKGPSFFFLSLWLNFLNYYHFRCCWWYWVQSPWTTLSNRGSSNKAIRSYSQIQRQREFNSLGKTTSSPFDSCYISVNSKTTAEVDQSCFWSHFGKRIDFRLGYWVRIQSKDSAWNNCQPTTIKVWIMVTVESRNEMQ